MDPPRASSFAIHRWLTEQTQHMNHVEYYLHQTHRGYTDPQRPHDGVGPGNKFEPDVINYFALQFMENPESMEEFIQRGIDLHREGQIHHRIWLLGDEGTDDQYRVSAIDAICSMRENFRSRYQTTSNNWDEIEEKIRENDQPMQKKYLLEEFEEMKAISIPDFSIISITDIPNIGIDPAIHEKLASIVNETVSDYKSNRGYTDLLDFEPKHEVFQVNQG